MKLFKMGFENGMSGISSVSIKDGEPQHFYEYCYAAAPSIEEVLTKIPEHLDKDRLKFVQELSSSLTV